MKIKTVIRRGQIWENKRSRLRVEVFGNSHGKWKCRVLTEKINRFNGTHTFAERTLQSKFILVV